jgi:hypothetical protein
LFTALNLLPSIATLAFVSRPICRQSATNWTQTLRSAGRFAEIGKRLVIRDKATGEPPQCALALKPAARLNPIEITIDGELEHRRRMGRAGCLGGNSAKFQFGQIELLNKGGDEGVRMPCAKPSWTQESTPQF